MFWLRGVLALAAGLALTIYSAGGEPLTDKPARTDRYGDPLPVGARLRLGTLRWRTDGEIFCAAFSPDGQTIVSGGLRTFCLWETSSGRELRRLPGQPWAIHAVAFSPDGKTLAWAGSDGDRAIHFLEASSGKEIRQLKGHKEYVSSLAFSPDGKMLASAGDEDTVVLWDSGSGTELRRLRGHVTGIRCVAFSAAGTRLASGGADGSLRLWEPATGKELFKRQIHQDKILLRERDGIQCEVRQLGECIHSVAFAPDGKILASGSDAVIRLLDVATGKELRQLDGNELLRVDQVAFSPDGKLLASRSWDHTVRLWDPETGRQVHRLQGQVSETGAIAFSPDSRRLVCGGKNSIRHWDVATGQELFVQFVGHERRVISTAFSRDGRVLASGSSDQTVRLWDPVNGKQLRKLDHPSTGRDTSMHIAFSPDGKVLASATSSYGDSIRLWDPATGKLLSELKELKGDYFGPSAIAFSPDGKRLAAGVHVGGLSIWDVASSRLLIKEVALKNNNCMASLQFSPDGKRLASAGFDSRIRLWDAATGKEILTIPDHGHYVYSVAFSPDGQTLVSASYDKSIRLWEAATGKELLRLQGHEEEVYAAAFSDDGYTIASASSDGTIRLWEVVSGKEILRLTGDASSVAFAHDGMSLATNAERGTLLIWDMKAVAGKLSPPKQAEDWDRLWGELAEDDAGQAYRAVWTLASDPGPAAKFLKSKLLPRRPSPEERIARFIHELDDDAFTVRENASRELRLLGNFARPALQIALKNQPSLEVQRRIERLLAEFPEQKPPQPGAVVGETLRVLRAIHALERIGTSAAVEVLKALAAGPPKARETQDAQAALERLARRPLAKN